jgi:hypothetical protein
MRAPLPNNPPHHPTPAQPSPAQPSPAQPAPTHLSCRSAAARACTCLASSSRRCAARISAAATMLRRRSASMAAARSRTSAAYSARSARRAACSAMNSTLRLLGVIKTGCFGGGGEAAQSGGRGKGAGITYRSNVTGEGTTRVPPNHEGGPRVPNTARSRFRHKHTSPPPLASPSLFSEPSSSHTRRSPAHERRARTTSYCAVPARGGPAAGRAGAERQPKPPHVHA